jgi:hypothetical protein
MLQASYMFFFISHMFWILARDKVIAQPEYLSADNRLGRSPEKSDRGGTWV